MNTLHRYDAGRYRIYSFFLFIYGTLMETELKLKIAEPDMVRLNDHPLLKDFAGSPPGEHRLKDTYYDTPKLELWRHGVTLRVREEGDSEQGATWVQTVKTAAPSSATLHERGEWESVLSSNLPQPVEIARQIKVDWIAKLLRSTTILQKLRPVFTNTTHRTTWNLELPDGQQVECALDSGSIECAGKSIAIGELELELKKGNPTYLFELALALHEEIPVQIANDSKAARGYALIETRAPQAVKARAVHLTRKMRLEDAFRTIGLNCLEHMEANVPEVLMQSVEGLHQMRVGLRRLRALMDMFGALAPLPAEISEGVEWLATELGATRDWDVLAGTTLKQMDFTDAAPLKELAAAKARDAHQALLLSLRGPRYTQVVLQLNGWFYGRHWRSSDHRAKDDRLSARAAVGMIPLLRRAGKRLGQRINSADSNDPATVHRVRIAAKKARYAAEFFADLLPRRAGRKYVSHLSKLQDHLGSFNDLEVAKRLLSELGGESSSRSAQFALGYFSSELRSSMAALPMALKNTRRLQIPIPT